MQIKRENKKRNAKDIRSVIASSPKRPIYISKETCVYAKRPMCMKRDLCKYNRPAKDIRSVIAPSPQETYIHIKRDLCVCKETYVYETRTAKDNKSMIASSPQKTYINIKSDLCVCKETCVYETRPAKDNKSMIASSPPPPTPTFSRFHLRALDKRPTPEIYNRKQVSIHIYESCFLL